jgi:hypothetical protein
MSRISHKDLSVLVKALHEAGMEPVMIIPATAFLRPCPTNPATHDITAVRCGESVQFIEHNGDAA